MSTDLLRRITRWLAQRELADEREAGYCAGLHHGYELGRTITRAQVHDEIAEAHFELALLKVSGRLAAGPSRKQVH